MQHLTSATRRGLQRLRRFMQSIRFRLTLWSVVILGLVLVVFSGFIVITQAHVLQVEAENQLQIQGQRLATYYDPESSRLRLPPFTSSREPLLTADSLVLIIDAQGAIVQQIGSLDATDAQRLIHSVVDRQGSPDPAIGAFSLTAVNRIAGVFLKGRLLDVFTTTLKHIAALWAAGLRGLPFSQTFTPTDPAAVAVTPRYLIYATPVLQPDNTFFGTLIVGAPLDFEAQLQRLIATLLLAVPATLLVALIGGYWLASRAMRPVHRITHTARIIGETDLSRRLNLNGSDEIGELARTFDQMLDRLQAAFARQRQFTADASHELRTPLTIVNLEVERALAQRRTPDEYERALSIIGAENNLMSRLVDNLLILARADAGQSALKLEAIDLSDVVSDVIARLVPLARRSGLEMVTGDLPELALCGDRVYLAQMLTNLIENAIKYTTGVGRHVWIEVERQSTATVVWGCVRVKDDGPGIAAEHLPYVFDRFYRADKARSHALSETADDETPDGSGLGLSIVQWVAQAHGGSVSVHSEVGRGATFEVRLPLLT